MRLFAALPIPAEALPELELFRARLRDELAGERVSWVHAGQEHLTLCFLGETDPEQVPALSASLTNAVIARPALRLYWTELGAFTGNRPRYHAAIWLGVGGEVDELHELAANVSHALGKPRGSPFTAHVTLCRAKAKSPRVDAAVSRLSQLNVQGSFQAWTADKVVFYESVPKNGRHEYRTIAEHELHRANEASSGHSARRNRPLT